MSIFGPESNIENNTKELKNLDEKLSSHIKNHTIYKNSFYTNESTGGLYLMYSDSTITIFWNNVHNQPTISFHSDYQLTIFAERKRNKSRIRFISTFVASADEYKFISETGTRDDQYNLTSICALEFTIYYDNGKIIKTTMLRNRVNEICYLILFF